MISVGVFIVIFVGLVFALEQSVIVHIISQANVPKDCVAQCLLCDTIRVYKKGVMRQNGPPPKHIAHQHQL
jgi:hypothetical protein